MTNTTANKTLEQRQQAIVQEFANFSDWEEKYKHIIALGKALEPLNERHRTEEYKVKGCQSQVWLYARLNSERQVVFTADSDSVLVKGLVALLLRLYSDLKPAEILAMNPQVLKDIGLDTHLTPSRANGLNSMLKQIHYYGQAFQILEEQR